MSDDEPSAQTDAQTTKDTSNTDTPQTTEKVKDALNEVLDSLTDITAIGGITYLATTVSDPTALTVGAIASVALGKRYMAKP
jgi:hypothetical protein